MPRPVNLATQLACAAHALGVVASGTALLSMWDPAERWLFSGTQLVAFTALAGVGMLCCGSALVMDWRRRSAGPSVLRHLFVVTVAWAAAQWLLANRFHAVLAWIAASAALHAFALLRLAWPALAPWLSRGIGRSLDRVTFQVCLVVALAEGGLRVTGALSKNPLFGLGDEDERAVMQRFSLAPGHLHFGFPCNDAGHYDEAFTTGTGQRDVALSIGDSFAVGCVPHRFHFTTVAEQELPGVRVHNLGVTAIGPAGYHGLLTNQGLALRPDAVVVNLFVGNDIGNSSRWQDPTSPLASFLDRRCVRLLQVPLRIARTWDEAQLMESDAHPLARNLATPTDDSDELRRQLPWLDDPLQEPPMFTPATFLALEVERARVLEQAELRGLYRSTQAALAAMHQACGKIPFAVILIPDEFQVEDALWAEVVARGGINMPRDDPQQRLTPWLQQEGIAVVDLLPLLLAVPPLADGRRHVYHLRDTHFNRRGNAVAGRAMAQLLRRLLGR